MKEKLLGSIWFWWAILTAIYIITTIFNIGPFSFIGRIVGLFVPFGILSLFTFATVFGWLGLLVFIFSTIYANKRLNALNIPLLKKIGLIFVALFIITFITDLARLTPFASIMILINGFDSFSL
jgi:hypothetical protein